MEKIAEKAEALRQKTSELLKMIAELEREFGVEVTMVTSRSCCNSTDEPKLSVEVKKIEYY